MTTSETGPRVDSRTLELTGTRENRTSSGVHMTLNRLALTNLRRSKFRSVIVFLSALLMAGVAVLASLVVQGSQQHLRSTLHQMGGDMLVLPFGVMKNELWSDAQFISSFTEGWMPRTRLAEIAAVKGVVETSPQLYIASLNDPGLNAAAEAYLIAYDPASDFTLSVWLPPELEGELALGEAIGGSTIRAGEAGAEFDLLGYPVHLKGHLASTGSDMDRGIFVGFDTAQQIIESAGLDVMPGTISAVLVRVAEGSHANNLAVEIAEAVPSVVAYESADFFQAQRRQLVGLMQGVLVLLTVTWGLSIVLIGLVSSLSVDERRREIGVLRALGAPAFRVVQILLTEGALLALGGGFLGALLFLGGASLFRPELESALGVPVPIGTPLALAALVLMGLAVALLSVLLGVLLPALRISRAEPAATIRE